MTANWTRIAGAECGTLLTGCVRGANHVDKNLPCQDASLAGVRYFKGYSYLLLAVADGHGAASYTRSELGAHFAVRAAAEAAARWVLFAVDSLEKQPDDWLMNARNEFGQRFVRHLRQSWERNVTEHLAAYPLEDIGHNIDRFKAYGTTVALALVFQGQVFAGSIGDSTVFLVREEAGATKALDLLTGEKAEGLGLTTDSLASADVVYKWKHKTLSLAETRMIVAATDGFADSLANPLLTLAALQRDTEIKGFGWLEDKLDDFLSRLTEQGVGDDIATVFYFPPHSKATDASRTMPASAPMNTPSQELDRGEEKLSALTLAEPVNTTELSTHQAGEPHD